MESLAGFAGFDANKGKMGQVGGTIGHEQADASPIRFRVSASSRKLEADVPERRSIGPLYTVGATFAASEIYAYFFY